jgi:acylphosphatase
MRDIDLVSAYIRVTGIVQGVGYRYFALRQADLFGIKGYVKNKADGSVELEVEGEKEIIEKFKSELQKGPGYSHVERVEVEYDTFCNKFTRFSVEY